MSKYHKDKADAVERQWIDLTRKLALKGDWTIIGEYVHQQRLGQLVSGP